MIEAFHGSNARFAKFEQSKARIQNDLYGGGIAYFTNSLDIAKSYARTMAKKQGDPIVYKVTLNFKKTFDTSKKYSGKDVKEFVQKKDPESFARGAKLLSLGTDKIDVLARLKEGGIELTGDQIFRGLSDGMVNTAKAREILRTLGFDSLKYDGGLMMRQGYHDVYLAYNASSVNIKGRYIVRNQEQSKDSDANDRNQYNFI